MKARALEKGQPAEGTSWGHECSSEGTCELFGISLRALYMWRTENAFGESI